jgi:hypothetical protein
MTCKGILYRVEDDIGPPLTVTHHGLDTTDLTITARFRKADGTTYTLTAIIDVVGDPGAGVAAEYHFEFQAGNLEVGTQEFDIHLAGTPIDDYSIPDKTKMSLIVREK